MLHPNNRLVSFPRSGHHALITALRKYFGDALKYRDPYKDSPGDHNLTKSHDFDLCDRVMPDHRYVVLLRSPVESICSRLDQLRREQPAGIDHLKPGSEDERQEMKRQADYYNRFFKKWVLDDVPNRVVVTYEKLMLAPIATLARIIRHMSDDKVNTLKVAWIANDFVCRRLPDYKQKTFHLL